MFRLILDSDKLRSWQSTQLVRRSVGKVAQLISYTVDKLVVEVHILASCFVETKMLRDCLFVRFILSGNILMLYVLKITSRTDSDEYSRKYV